jgi:hypothetical protein
MFMSSRPSADAGRRCRFGAQRRGREHGRSAAGGSEESAVKSWATLGGLIAVVLVVVGYPTIEGLFRNQVCEALRGAEECYLERRKEELQQRLKEVQAWAKELEQQTEELRRKYVQQQRLNELEQQIEELRRKYVPEELSRKYGPMPIPPTHPPDDRPIGI